MCLQTADSKNNSFTFVIREASKPGDERDEGLIDEYIALCNFYSIKIDELKGSRSQLLLFSLHKALVYALVLIAGLGLVSGVTDAAGLTHIWHTAVKYVGGIFSYSYTDKDEQPDDADREMWDILLSDGTENALTNPISTERRTYYCIADMESD